MPRAAVAARGMGALVLDLRGHGDSGGVLDARVMDDLLAGLPVLKELGVEKINSGVGALMGDDPVVTGSAIAGEQHYEWAAEAFRVVAGELASLGMTCSFEIHMHSLHDTAVSTLKLLDMIGRPLVTANIDAGTMLRTPHAEEALAAVGI